MARKGKGQVDEEPAGPRADQNGAEEDEEEDIGGHDHDGDSVDAVLPHEDVVQDGKPGIGGAVEHTEEVI